MIERGSVAGALLTINTAAVAVVAAFVVGCVNPPPTASPTPTPTPSATPTSTPTPATGPGGPTISVLGRGTIECRMQPHGCEASFLIRPAPWQPETDFEPADDDPSFGARPFPWELNDEPATGVLETIAPGEYTFAIAVSEPNDIVGDPDRYVWSQVLCTREVTVPANATHVAVLANFGPPCFIHVAVGTP